MMIGEEFAALASPATRPPPTTSILTEARFSLRHHALKALFHSQPLSLPGSTLPAIEDNAKFVDEDWYYHIVDWYYRSCQQ